MTESFVVRIFKAKEDELNAKNINFEKDQALNKQQLKVAVSFIREFYLCFLVVFVHRHTAWLTS